jgi:methionine-rich copper-binding protein CopC/putative copper export protein
MRRCGRALLSAVALLLMLPASHVFAHANFLGSDPADGTVFRVAPPFADLHFSEGVLLEASSVTLLHLGPGTSERLHISSQGGGSTVRATFPALANGAYILRFVVVDPADLHRTVGSVSFGIGVDAPLSEGGSELSGSRWSVALRASTDALLILGVGSVVVMWLCHRQGVPMPTRAPRLAVRSGVGACLGWIGLFVLSVTSVGFAHARWATLLISSDPGRRALIGVELAAGLWWVGRMLRRARTAARPQLIGVLAILMAGFLVLAALGGHSAVGGDSLVGSALRVAHYGSFCLWLGTVAALWWETRAATDPLELWPAVSRIAVYGLAMTGLTGLLLSARVVATVTGLLGTFYGRVVVGKIAVVLLLGLFGAFAARSVIRNGAPRHVPIEFSLGVGALVMAGMLANSVPAVGARFDAVPAGVPQVVTHDIADLTVSALLQPARPGPNLVRLSVLETRRPSPGDVQRVTMTLTRADGTEVATREGVPSSGVLEWSDVELAAPGPYAISVRVDRPALAVPDFNGDLTVAATPVLRAATVVSNRRWAAIALPLAGGWIALVTTGGWLMRRRRRQGSNRYPLARTVTR